MPRKGLKGLFLSLFCSILSLFGAEKASADIAGLFSWGDTLPTSCAAPQLFLDTNAVSGKQFYACEAGVFVLQGITCTESTPGNLVCTSVTTSDRTTEPGNKLSIYDNDVAFTNDPTCANSGVAGELTLIDVDESSAEDWRLCNGTSTLFDVLDTGSDVIASAETLIGTGTGIAAYVPITGQASVTSGGVWTNSDLTCTGCLTTTDLGTDSVDADELNATGVESELETALDIGGEVTSAGLGSTVVADTLTVAGWTLTTAIIPDPTLDLKDSAAPAPTVEGRVEWESDDDHLIVGDGSAQVEFVPAEDVSGAVTLTDAGLSAFVDDQLTVAKVADGDWGDFTITSNVAALDTDFEEETHASEHDGRSTTASADVLNADAELYTDTKCLNVDPANATTNWLMWKVPLAATVTGIDCIVDAATSVVMTPTECDANGGSCSDIEAAITCGTTNTTEASSVDNATLDAGDWVRVTRGTMTGTPTQAVLCIEFTFND